MGGFRKLISFASFPFTRALSLPAVSSCVAYSLIFLVFITFVFFVCRNKFIFYFRYFTSQSHISQLAARSSNLSRTFAPSMKNSTVRTSIFGHISQRNALSPTPNDHVLSIIQVTKLFIYNYELYATRLGGSLASQASPIARPIAGYHPFKLGFMLYF